MLKIVYASLLVAVVIASVQSSALLNNPCTRSGFFPLVDNTPEYYGCYYVPGGGYELRYLTCINGDVFSTEASRCVPVQTTSGMARDGSDIENPTIPPVASTTKATPPPHADNEDEDEVSSSSAAPEASTESSSVPPEVSTESSSVAPEASTESSSVAPEVSTESSSEAPEVSTESSSEAPEVSTESSSSVAPEASTESSSSVDPEASTESSSSVAPEVSTESSSSVAPESSTESSSSVAPESSTESSSSVAPEASTESSSSVAPETSTSEPPETLETEDPEVSTDPTSTVTPVTPPYQCIATGFYARDNCEEFYYCVYINGELTALEFSCPEGMQFNPNGKYCDVDTDCNADLNVNGLKELQREFKCEVQGAYPYPGDCSKYYSCWWNVERNGFFSSVMNCPVGKVFDEHTGKCAIEQATTCLGR